MTFYVDFWFLLVSDCRFHDFSFPYDLCGSMVLVDEPVFAVPLVPRLSHSALSCSSCNLTTIVCWSFRCEILLCMFILFVHLYEIYYWIQWAYCLIVYILFCIIFTLCSVFFRCCYHFICCRTMCHDWPLLALLLVIIVWVHVAVCTSATCGVFAHLTCANITTGSY